MTSRNRFLAASLALLLLAFGAFLFYRFLFPPHRPLHLLALPPALIDDGDTASLIAAAERQDAILARKDPDALLVFGDKQYSIAWLRLSVQELIAELRRQPDPVALQRFLAENYLVYQAGGRQGRRGRQMLVTGYYEPLFAGSLSRTPPFIHPLHRLPEGLVSLPGEKGGLPRIGRYDREGRFLPFWSRREIEEQGLLAEAEIAYLADPFDAFLLHVQGSGRLRLPDGSVRSLGFAGHNGHPYRSIGKQLVERGAMPLAKVTIPAIRAYLQEHPQELSELLYHNPRFIFFAWRDNLGPRGSSGEVLTPGRSVAIDHLTLPGGAIAYLSSRRPLFAADGRLSGWTDLGRLVFPQDSGAAIEGAGRVDLFWGNGAYAEAAASHMKEEGHLYFLVKKGYPGEEPAGEKRKI